MGLLIASVTANAGVIEINSQDAFNARGTIVQNTNFQSYGSGFSFPSNPLVIGNETFRANSPSIGGDDYGFSQQNFTDNSISGVTIDIANSFNLFAVDAGNYDSAGAQTFNVITNLGTYSFTENLTSATYTFFGFEATGGENIISFNDGSGNLAPGFTNVQLGNVSAVPVPAAVWLFASGLLGLGALRKKAQA